MVGNTNIGKSFFIICLVFLLGIQVINVHAQESGFEESFDNPELPGWDRSPDVEVNEGVLLLGPENLIHRPGSWGDQQLSIRFRRIIPGDFVVSFQTGGVQGYHLVVGIQSATLQREVDGNVINLQDTALEENPTGEWYVIRIEVFGSDLFVRINNEEPQIHVSGVEPLSPGGISIETFQETVLEIDEIIVFVPGGDNPQDEMDGDSTTADSEDAPKAELPTLPWVSTGGPSGGLGYDIRMDPRDTQVMYVTDALAGAFKSTDGGISWFPINNGITTRTGSSGDAIPVFSLTIDPNAPDTLWVGTQFSGGVFRSDNGGETWNNMSNGILERNLTIRGFTVEQGNSDVVYLAGEVSSWDWNVEPLNGIMFDLTRGAVYKSTDKGENWSPIWYGDHLARYVIIHPDDHQKLFVSTGIFDREAANSDPETLQPGGVGVVRTLDGGLTWEELGVNNGFRFDELYIGSLAMHPEDPDILFAAAGSDAHLSALEQMIGAIYKTENGGESWDRVLDLPNASAVEICPSDPNVVYGGASSFITRSDDGGKTWQYVNGTEGRLDLFWGPDDVVAGFPIDMQCDPDDPMKIFVNNYGGGNFLSTDGGLTWVNSSDGYTGAIMHTVTSVSDNPALVFSSARSGIFMSNDGGDTWKGMARGPARALEALAVAVDPFDSTHLIAVISDAGPIPKISDDGGNTWHEANNQLKNNDTFLWRSMQKIGFSPTELGLVIGIEGENKCDRNLDCSEGMGVIYSDDGGETWSQSDIQDGMATGLAFAPDGSIFVVIHPGDLYLSVDGGKKWILVSEDILPGVENPDPGMFLPAMNALAVDPDDPSRLYAGFSFGGVAISEDGGKTWQNSSAGMIPETVVFDLAPDSAHPGVIYAASYNSGVYRSLDFGRTWQTFNEGLSNRTAKSLSLSADGQILYLGTEGGGVFRLSPDGKAPTFTVLSENSTGSSADDQKEDGEGQDHDQTGPEDELPVVLENDNPALRWVWLLPVFLGGGLVYYLFFRRKNQA